MPTPSAAFEAAERALLVLIDERHPVHRERWAAERALAELRTALERGHTYEEAVRLGILIE